jgi:hypothetical protein
VFDPQGDGKVVVQWNKGEVQRLAWYSKAQNSAHDVGVTADELSGDTFGAAVAMAADKIVLSIISARSPGGVESRTILSLSLTGTRTKVADVSGSGPIGGLDSDGRRVAWIDFAGVRVADLP